MSVFSQTKPKSGSTKSGGGNIQGGPVKNNNAKPAIQGGPVSIGSKPAGPVKKKRPGGGRWRKNAAGQGGRPISPVRATPSTAPPGRGGSRRGTPERQAIHAQRQAGRRDGSIPRLGRQMRRGGPGGQMQGGQGSGGMMGGQGPGGFGQHGFRELPMGMNGKPGIPQLGGMQSVMQRRGGGGFPHPLMRSPFAY